jgi:ABC-type transport system substrate-binding protein
MALHAMSRIVRYQVYKYPDRVRSEVIPDAASWEISPDGLTYTFKLRPNLKFDPRPPTNGRIMNSADVKWSWEHYEG